MSPSPIFPADRAQLKAFSPVSFLPRPHVYVGIRVDSLRLTPRSRRHDTPFRFLILLVLTLEQPMRKLSRGVLRQQFQMSRVLRYVSALEARMNLHVMQLTESNVSLAVPSVCHRFFEVRCRW
jgi:hypothetical protein